MESAQTILAVEDDPAIVDLLREIAGRLFCQLESCGDGKSGLEAALSGNHALVVLDLQLPLVDGLEICRQVRSKKPTTPILILTSRVDETDKVLGLEIGADDYVTKPFGSRELEARLKALMRRAKLGKEAASSTDTDSVIRIGPLVIDLFNRRVTVNSQEIDLTATEFAILTLLASYPGRTFTRKELLEQIWGYHASGNDPTLSTHLSRIRHKLEPDPMNPIFVTTIHGVGYRFNPTPKPD